MKLTISLGSLTEARHPVMIGHFAGEPLSALKRQLDIALEGRITAAFRAGGCSGILSTHATVSALKSHPPGVILVGLGERGTLTRSRLQQTTHAALNGHSKVSALLMGTSGARALPISASVQAILAAAAAANVVELELIELYADRTAAIMRSLDLDSGATVPLQLSFRTLPGHQSAAPLQPTRTSPLHRLRITLEGEQMQFELLSEHAQVLRIPGKAVTAEGGALIKAVTEREAVRSTDRALLHQNLIPAELQTILSDGSDISLILDTNTAWIPWEALDYSSGQQPLSARAAMTRRIHVPSVNVHTLAPPSAKSLVIADPLSPAGSNEAIREEAHKLVKRLESHGLEVHPEIPAEGDRGVDSAALLERLNQEPWRILHFFGHGVRLGGNSTGLVSGKHAGEGFVDEFYIKSEMFRELSHVPELVFLNSCFAGRVGASSTNNLASLARALVQMGVRMLVATAWVIGDDEADAFSDGFYEALLGGRPFGEAVRQGRQQCFDACKEPNTNTWAAYQCYGDPGYVFTQRRSTLGSTHPAASLEAPARLTLAQPELLMQALQDGIAPVRKQLREFEQDAPKTPEVHAILGETWLKLACWDDAQRCLEKAAAAGHLQVAKSLVDAELLGACEQWRSGGDPAKGLESAQRRAKALQSLQPSHAWHNLQAAIDKRRAWINKDLSLLEPIRRDYAAAAALSPSTYSLINVAHLSLLLNQRDATLDTCQKAEDALKQETDTAPHFWVRLARARVALFRCLLEDGDEEAVIAGYRAHLSAIYSPWQLSLVRDYLDIAADLLAQQRRMGESRKIRRIRRELQAYVHELYPQDACRIFGGWGPA